MPFSEETMRYSSYVKIPLKRVGECDACANRGSAWCCDDMPVVELHSLPLSDDLVLFLKTRGMDIGEDKQLHVSIVHKCKEYDSETRRCKIYDDRPSVCRVFPEQFKQLYDAGSKICGYDWDLDTSVEIDFDLFKLCEVYGFE